MREDDTLLSVTGLTIAVKTMNDIAGPSAIVPQLLEFCALPRTSIRPVALPTQRKDGTHAEGDTGNDRHH